MFAAATYERIFDFGEVVEVIHKLVSCQSLVASSLWSLVFGLCL